MIRKILTSNCFLVFILIAFSLGLRLWHLRDWNKYKTSFFYNERPLMTTMDAYYYLRLTRDLVSNNYKHKDKLSPIQNRPYPIPLLVIITAGLKKVTHLPLEWIAFFTPCVLSLLMIIPYFLWGKHLGGKLTFFISSLIGVSSFYWYKRTCLGRFDTDSLIPFFIYLIPFLMYKFITEKKLFNRSLFLIVSLFLSFCFYLWWTPALYLIPFLLLAPYGLSVFIWPCNKIEKCIKYGILGISILCLIIISFNLGRFLPFPMNSFFQKASIMLNFVAKKTTSSLPNISESISELNPPSLQLICDQIFGNVFNFLIFLFGLCILTYKFWRYLVFLVVPIGLCLLSIFGKRFLIYVVPFYALCIGVLFTFVYNLFSKKRSQQILINILFGCLVVVTIFFNSKKSLSITLFPIINSYDVKLATTVKNKDGVIWTWWDYGYFLQYYTGCPTIIDGGSQDPLRTYITAFPLATSNPILAKNWMHFFAAHSVYGFYKINNYFHSYSNTMEFLKNIFATQNLDNITKKYPIFQKHPELKKYVFPDVQVYLYLPVRLYLLSYWWYYFGTWDYYIKNGIHPKTYLLKPGSFYIDRVNGMLRTRSQNIPIKDLYFYGFRNGRYFIQKISFNHQAIFDIFLNLDGTHIFLFDKDFSNCLFMKLTLLKPNISGFNLVSYIPFHGCVWKN